MTGNTIKEQIIAKLESIDAIAEVNGAEITGFDKNPAVNVMFGGNDSEFWSVATNERAYRFTLRVYIPLKGNPSQSDDGKVETDNTMLDVIDSIINAFDEDITLGGEVDYLLAAISDPGYVQGPEGWLRTGDVKLQAVKYINVRPTN